jgi:CheY-like chemotaxis protein
MPSPSVLLVEDETIVAAIEAQCLSLRGYAVDKAATGEEAVELFSSGHAYDLLIADIELGPGIDGIETAKLIRKVGYIPVVFLTSLDRRDVRNRAEGLGNYGYVQKGTGKEPILEAVAEALAVPREKN